MARLLNRSVMGLAQKRCFVWGFQTFFLPSVFLFEWLHHLEIFLCLNLAHYHFRALHSKNISPPPTAFPSEVFTLVVYLLGCVCVKVAEESHGQTMAVCRLVAPVGWVRWSQVHQPLSCLMLVGNLVSTWVCFEQRTWGTSFLWVA